LSDSSIAVWDVNNQFVVLTLTGHNGIVNCVKMLSDGITLASASADKTIKLWNIYTGTLIATLTGHTYPVTSLDQLNNGLLISAGTNDGTIRVWNVATFTLFKTLLFVNSTNCTGCSSQNVNSLKVLSNGDFASAVYYVQNSQIYFPIYIWNASSFTIYQSLNGSTSTITQLELLSDGTLASVSGDQKLRIWNTTSGAQLANYNPLNPYGNQLFAVRQVSSNPIVLASAGLSANVSFFNAQTQMFTLVTPLGGANRYSSMIVFNSTLVFTVSYDYSQLQSFNQINYNVVSPTLNIRSYNSSASVLWLEKFTTNTPISTQNIASVGFSKFLFLDLIEI
jgi:WD40 repeat protein